MKVVMVGTLPPIIGISPYCLHLSYALSKIVDLEFISFEKFSKTSKFFLKTNKINEKMYDKFLKDIPTKKTLNWNSFLSGIKAGIGLDCDVLHVQWWISSLLPVYLPILMMAKSKKIKVVCSVHNIFPHEKNKKSIFLNKIANKILFPFVDIFIVHNERNKKDFIKIYNIDEKKIHVITHGVLNFIKNKNIAQNDARTELNLPLGKKILLFLGYIRPYKGLDILIKTFRRIKSQDKKTILLIAGQPFMDTWEKYDTLIKKNNLEDDIIVRLGFIAEERVQYYLTAADVVVLPYKHLDTHGGIAALAVNFKKPIIVTDVGGLPEYTYDKRAIAKPKDIKDLTKKILNVLNDKDLYSKLSQDSFFISKKITWDYVAEKTLKVYKKII